MNYKYILEGWENFISKSEETEEKAKEKALICSVCPELKKGTLTAFIKDKIKDIQGCYCDVCKCPTSALIRSSKPCPLKKF